MDALVFAAAFLDAVSSSLACLWQAETEKSVTFLKVDVDEAGALKSEYRVSAMPTFMVRSSCSAGCARNYLLALCFRHEPVHVSGSLASVNFATRSRVCVCRQFFKGGQKVSEFRGADLAKLKAEVARLK
jgi:hypothetical protein